MQVNFNSIQINNFNIILQQLVIFFNTINNLHQIMKSTNSDKNYMRQTIANPDQLQYTTAIKSHKKEFSFQKNNIMIVGQEYIEYQNYYITIKNKLKQLEIENILDTAIDWLKLNDKLHSQFCILQQENVSKDEEIKLLKESLQKKREAFQQIIHNQEKNRNLIEKLQTQLQSKNKQHCFVENSEHSCACNKSFGMEGKYKQLSKYMNEYIHQTNEVQQQFKRNYTLLKKQNQRWAQKYSELTKSLNESTIKNKVLEQQLQKVSKISKINQENGTTEIIDKDLNNLHENIKSSIIKMYKNNQIKKQLQLEGEYKEQEGQQEHMIKYQSSISQGQQLDKEGTQKMIMNQTEQNKKQINNQSIKNLEAAMQAIKQIQTENKYLTTQIIKLKYNLKQFQEEIEDLEQKKISFQNEIIRLTQQNFDIHKSKNDQTERFIKQIQRFQIQNKVLRDQIENMRKNYPNKDHIQSLNNINIKYHNHSSNQNSNNLKNNNTTKQQFISNIQSQQNQMVRNRSQKSIKKQYVYVPPLNLSGTNSNKPFNQIDNNSTKSKHQQAFHKDYQIAFNKVKF